MNKTHIPIQKKKTKWYLVDAKDKNLGRLSTQIAVILRGKNDVEYTPYIKSPSHVIVINAKKVSVSGQKKSQKTYKRHSGRPGGLKTETFEQLNKRIPNRIVEKAIKGMLPKGSLGKELFAQLKVYAGENHPHIAQRPELISSI
uniref:ribosomal protein L13 n=1 Tax=Gloiopeltis furcata TaxID=42017 RepID=UPI0028D38414|nr:ribosomal protein L13 [Gloiopeltis furcata]WMP13944.1 ribosomal protein L13 [Gloiopeltis furcata]